MHSLTINRTIQAPIEKVFEALTTADILTRWMGPGEVNCESASVDLKVGGDYRIHMKSSDGDHIVVGQYKEITRPHKLQFTWAWEGGESPETLVTITLESKDQHTAITLLHENFPVKEPADKHTQGWNGCLDKLEKVFQN